MIRSLATLAIRQAVQTRAFVGRIPPVVPVFASPTRRNFSTFLRSNAVASHSVRTPITLQPNKTCLMESSHRLLDALAVSPMLQTQPHRTVIKFSMRKGKRKTVKAVVKRFKRLDWGGWIRTISGRHKKMWRKKGNRKRRLRQHVLVNGTQATLLDKMVTKYWKRPRYYINDPYAPYHSREEFVYTRRKALK
ncbi:39S ribosomal protein L35, mitochondrial [Anopheles maculipalpis]|uniref:39S ribosomal protein L35, mitochondrial n=1 Tax=Anopheles maculipalpis TaxID=1496333 RepID=UPI0021591903|nr:39S ribosomal protein L35, mitochondrial [Anopheles maculipalpis]